MFSWLWVVAWDSSAARLGQQLTWDISLIF